MKERLIMKKIIALILASVMMLTLAACGKTPAENPGNTTAPTTTPTTKVPTKEELAAAASVEAIAKAQLNKFIEFAGMRASYDEYMAELEEADRIPFEEFISYQVTCRAIEKNEEWLTALESVPTGFSEAYTYGPNMMGQAFIGYIFRVAEGTNVESFKANLKEICIPRWNICTEANTIICESYGNIVFFSMMVVIDNEHPDGFTAAQKQEFLNTFTASIEGSAK